jgi:hypothetical protein
MTPDQDRAAAVATVVTLIVQDFLNSTCVRRRIAEYLRDEFDDERRQVLSETTPYEDALYEDEGERRRHETKEAISEIREEGRE